MEMGVEVRMVDLHTTIPLHVCRSKPWTHGFLNCVNANLLSAGGVFAFVLAIENSGVEDICNGDLQVELGLATISAGLTSYICAYKMIIPSSVQLIQLYPAVALIPAITMSHLSWVKIPGSADRASSSSHAYNQAVRVGNTIHLSGQGTLAHTRNQYST
jgi:hypothetical protein